MVIAYLWYPKQNEGVPERELFLHKCKEIKLDSACQATSDLVGQSFVS